jgi:hypothetical protein
MITDAFDNKSIDDIYELQLKYHADCYSKFTNKGLISKIQHKCLLCEKTCNPSNDELCKIDEKIAELLKSHAEKTTQLENDESIR